MKRLLFPLKFSGSRALLCGLGSGKPVSYSPCPPPCGLCPADPSPCRLSHCIGGPHAGDSTRSFCGRKCLKQIFPEPQNPANPTGSAPGQQGIFPSPKRLRSQGAAANSRGPQTKCPWDESRALRSSFRDRKRHSQWGVEGEWEGGLGHDPGGQTQPSDLSISQR